MNRYITYEPYTENVGNVSGIYYGAISETIKEGPYILESESPDPSFAAPPGMEAVLRVNLETGELYCDFEKEVTIQSRVSELEETNNQLNEELGNLLMQNAFDKATITELNETVGGLMLEVAALKGGAA